ncbi:hypothetical protein B0H12DRAFT_44705 [Mycena haematopus]|nr:hypothetical protein B0H12DRAFT_44705 [Mycena haematopus]
MSRGWRTRCRNGEGTRSLDWNRGQDTDVFGISKFESAYHTATLVDRRHEQIKLTSLVCTDNIQHTVPSRHSRSLTPIHSTSVKDGPNLPPAFPQAGRRCWARTLQGRYTSRGPDRSTRNLPIPIPGAYTRRLISLPWGRDSRRKFRASF